MTRDDARRRRAPAVAAGARAGRRDAGGGPGSAAAADRAGGAPHQVAGILLLVGRPVGSRCATSCSAIGFTWRRSPRSPTADWIVGDLGCGTGQVERRARAVRRAGDRASTLRRRCCRRRSKRLHGLDNVDLRRGDLEALPIDDARLDAATLMLVLHHVPEPARALAEVARVLKPGGRADRRGHAAARSRELPAADGARVARIFARNTSTRLLSDAGFERTSASCRCPPDRESERTGACSWRRAKTAAAKRGHEAPRLMSSSSQTRRMSSMATVVEKLHPFAAAKAAGREPFKVQDLVARRVRPQGNPPRRAGNARPDGAARAARRARSRSPARASWAACT